MSTSSDALVAIPQRGGVLGSYVDGWTRTLRAPVMVCGAFAATALAALPSAVDSLDWISIASDLARLIRIAPEVYSIQSLELAGLLPTLPFARDLAPGLIGPVVGYLLLWIFLSGGILDRLARGRPVGTAAFFAACGTYFFRFLRLNLIAGALYWVLLRSFAASELEPWSFIALVVTAASVMVIVDMAQARAVVEDRRSMAGALLASLRFVRRRPLRVLGLHAVHLIVLAITAMIWSRFPVPDAVVASLVVASLYLLLQLYFRLALSGAQMAFFQSELAHATYTAAPLPIWPDSPSAEAIDNFLQRRDKSPPS